MKGGKRQGSGRKNEGKLQVCYRLAPDVVEFLRNNERPASRIIEDAVREYEKFLEINGDNMMENLYIKKQPTLEELIAIKPRLFWVQNSVYDDKVLIMVDNYELLVSTWMYYEMLTDDEIKQFLNGEQ